MRFAAVLVAFTVCSAFAQDIADQVTIGSYRFTGSAPSARDYQELATVIRTVADAREVNIDPDAVQLTFSGRGDAPEISEWLLRQLDKAPGTQPSEPPEFHSTRKDDNAAVFYLAHSPTPRDVQELLTTLRVVGDVQKIFSYTALHALAVRAPAAQMTLVKWMIQSVDRDAGTANTRVPEFHIDGVRDPVVRVYYLAHAQGQDLNHILTALRTTGEIQKTFSTSKSLVVRGAPEQMAKVEGIVLSMDQQLAH